MKNFIQNIALLFLLLSPGTEIFGRGSIIYLGADPTNPLKANPDRTPEEYRNMPGGNWAPTSASPPLGEQWMVPKLVGNNYDTDLAGIKKFIGPFKIRKVTRLRSEAIKGTVISQKPVEYEAVDKPGFIDIKVSLGPAQ